MKLMKFVKHQYLYNTRSGSWGAKTRDTKQWIGVEFETAFEIKAIQTQSRYNVDQWVKTYTVSYSLDGFIWNNYLDGDGAMVSPHLDLHYSQIFL